MNRSVVVLSMACLLAHSACTRSKSSPSISKRSSEPISTTTFPMPLKDVAFGKLDRAWVVTGRGDLLYTLDAGRNWSTVSRKLVGGFSLISFVDGERGWAVNHSGEVWVTQDSLSGWSKLSEIPYRTAVPPGGGIFDLAFADSDNGWAEDLSSVWSSSDGGRSWIRHPFELDSAPPNVLLEWCRFHGELSAWCFTQSIQGEGRRMFSTADGGRSWQENQTLKSLEASTVFRLDESIAWAQDDELGTICRTTDSGRHWDVLHSFGRDSRVLSLFFLNETDGWATSVTLVDRGAKEDAKTGGMLFHTVDGGKNWERISSVPGVRYFDRVYFADYAHGWLTSFDEVYYTTDGGENWTCVLTIPKDAW
jgi:photosystem II stability/assembly factor-like uncharacterized protein